MSLFPNGVAFVVTAPTLTASGLIRRICEKAFIKKNHRVNNIQIWMHGAEDLVTCRHVYWGAHGSDALTRYLISVLSSALSLSRLADILELPSPTPNLIVETQGASDRLKGTEL